VRPRSWRCGAAASSDFRQAIFDSFGGHSGTLAQPSVLAPLLSAACEEDPSRLREASARTRNSDLGSHHSRASPLVNVHPSSRKRPVRKLVAKALDLESLARPARVADGSPLVRHGLSTVPACCPFVEATA
jgi:hypothetical protein